MEDCHVYQKTRFRDHFLLLPKESSIGVQKSGWTRKSTEYWNCWIRNVNFTTAHTAQHEIELILIGDLLDPSNSSKSNQDLLDTLLGLYSTVESAAEFLFHLSGNFVLIISAEDQRYVFHDALGLRTVFYDRTGSETGLFSDPAVLKEFSLTKGLTIRGSFFDSRHYLTDEEWWLPAGLSLYEEISSLVPNHYLRFSNREQVRFFPNKERPQLDALSVAGGAATILRNTMDAISNRHRLIMQLTAGVDSRTLIAAAREHANELLAVTVSNSVNKQKDSEDITIARKLAKHLRVTHMVIVPDQVPPQAFIDAFDESSQFAHTSSERATRIWNRSISLPDGVEINSHGSEVARCRYYPYRKGIAPEIIRSEQLLDLVPFWDELPFVRTEIASWHDSLRRETVGFGVQTLDLFHWEHRLGSWGAQNFKESSLATHMMSPFNNRGLLDLLLSAPPRSRSGPDYTLMQMVWARLWPEVIEIPVNPASRRTFLLKSLLARIRLLHHVRKLKQFLSK